VEEHWKERLGRPSASEEVGRIICGLPDLLVTATRTRDVQLGNLPSDWKYRTYASKALNPDHLEPWKIKNLRLASSLTQ
jgi:hypothetical protein